MRVLFWTEAFWPHIGGLEVFTAHLAPVLRQRGHELVIMTTQLQPTWPRQADYSGIPIYRFPFLRALLRRDLAEINAIRRDILHLKRDFRPDLIHVNFTGPSDFFRLRTPTPDQPPTLLVVHSPVSLTANASLPLGWRLGEGEDITEPHANSLHGEALRGAAWVVAVSQALLNDLRVFAPDIISRSSVIYNGLIWPDIAPTPLPWHPPRLLCLGRLELEKAFDVALRALPTVLARHPQARLIIAGDGPARADLEALTASLGLTASVEFTGWVPPDDVPALINTATLIVMPSRWREPFGLVALQASQMARPVVATRVGGLPEIIAHGETGLVVGNEDTGGLAQAILDLLDHPARAERLGQAGRQRAQTVFGFDRCVDAYAALYRQLGRI